MISNNQSTVRFPLVLPACALLAGIVAGKFTGLGSMWMVLGVGALAAAGVCFKFHHLNRLTLLAVLASVFCFGAGYCAKTCYTIPENHIATYCPSEPMFATVRGRIASSVQLRDDKNSPGYHRPPRTHFLLQANKIQTHEGWENVCGLVSVTILEPAQHLRTGQDVELVGTISRTGAVENPGQVDWNKIARRTRVFVRITMKIPESVTIVSQTSSSPVSVMVNNLRASAREHLQVSDDLYEGHLLNALILGHRDRALARLNGIMARAGIAHFLSISGLHLGIFLWFVYLVCRVLSLRPATCAYVVLGLIGGYILLAQPRPALLRSALMAGAMCAGVIAGRRYTALNALGLAAIVLVCIDPQQVFDPGFQLSFLIVAGVIILQPELMDLLFGGMLRNKGLEVHRNSTAIGRRVRRVAGFWCMSIVTVGLAAWLVSAPLIAYLFMRFSPYAAVLSILVFPFVVLVLVPGYLAILLGMILPGLAGVFQRWAVNAAALLDKTVSLFDSIPGLSIELYPVNTVWVLLCYAVLALVVFHRRIRGGRIIAASSVILLAVFTVITQLPAAKPAGLEVNLLSVGSGQCAVCRTPDGSVFLVDAGTQSSWDAYNEALKPFLQARKIPQPATAFISHDNIDHFNILSNLPENSSLRTIIVHPWFSQGYSPASPPARLLKSFELPPRQVEYIKAPATLKIDGSTSVQVLWPEENNSPKYANETSLVLRIACNDRSILFCGDIEQAQQEKLLENPNLLQSDVLVLPHHGAWNAALEKFVNAVGPQVILASSGRNRVYTYSNDPTNTARREFYEKINRKYRYHSTAANGWICVDMGKYAPITVKTMR